MQPINLATELSAFSEHWQPRVVGQFNGPAASDYPPDAYLSKEKSGCQWGTYLLSKINLNAYQKRISEITAPARRRRNGISERSQLATDNLFRREERRLPRHLDEIADDRCRISIWLRCVNRRLRKESQKPKYPAFLVAKWCCPVREALIVAHAQSDAN